MLQLPSSARYLKMFRTIHKLGPNPFPRQLITQHTHEAIGTCLESESKSRNVMKHNHVITTCSDLISSCPFDDGLLLYFTEWLLGLDGSDNTAHNEQLRFHDTQWPIVNCSVPAKAQHLAFFQRENSCMQMTLGTSSKDRRASTVIHG